MMPRFRSPGTMATPTARHRPTDSMTAHQAHTIVYTNANNNGLKEEKVDSEVSE